MVGLAGILGVAAFDELFEDLAEILLTGKGRGRCLGLELCRRSLGREEEFHP